MTVFAKSNSTETVRPIVVTFQDQFIFGRLRCSLLLPYSNSGQVTRFKPTASVYSRTFEVDGSFGTSSLTNTNEHATTNNPFSSHFSRFSTTPSAAALRYLQRKYRAYSITVLCLPCHIFVSNCMNITFTFSTICIGANCISKVKISTDN